MWENYANRRSKLMELLKKENISKALIGNPTSIFYLAGEMIHPYERFVGLLLDVDNNESTMIVPGVNKGCMNGRDIKEVVYSDNDGPKSTIENLVGKVEVLGVDTQYFSMKVGTMLSEIASNIVDISNYPSILRRCKDDIEIDTIQNAVRCAQEAFEEIKPYIKPGVTEKELSLKLYESMAKKDGIVTDKFVIQVLAGKRGANPHGISGDYVLKKGDGVTVDFGAYYNYYWSDMTRTFFIEEIDPEMKKIYEIVLEANKRALASVKAGKSIKEIDLIARDYITEQGYGEYFIHRIGHGIGLDIHEAPYIHDRNEDVLEEGMIFTIEPGIYIPNLGGVRIEDDVLVTKDGHKVLSTYSKNIEDMILH